MVFHFFELSKLPDIDDSSSLLHLWLALFRANTEEELNHIKKMEVSELSDAVNAYYTITASSEFREKERLYEKARHNEASALYNAREKERLKWEGVLAEKDAELAEKEAENEELRRQLAEYQSD